MGRTNRASSRTFLAGLLAAATLAACGGGSSTPSLTSIAVGPQPVAVVRGSSTQLRATGTYSDGSTADVTAQATWISSTAAVAAVSATGALTGKAVGTTTVSATVTTVTGQATATVSLPALSTIVVQPATADIFQERTRQLTAIATWADGVSEDVTLRAAWSSGNPAAITVNAAGLASAPASAALGSVAMSASLSGKQGGSTLVVVPRVPIGPDLANDPLATQQWYLRNTGQDGYADTGGVAGMDLNLANTYLQGFVGAGVKVAVVDSGLEIAHEDLAGNVVHGSWNFLTASSDPSPADSVTDGDHGTSVGGIIAMVYGNAKGGMGVAPGASLNGYNVLAPGGTQSVSSFVRSLGGSPANPASADISVFNQSWGTDDTTPVAADPTLEAQYLDGVTNLRGGKGALYVKSSGNGFRSFGTTSSPAVCSPARAAGVSCQNASMDGLNTLPYNLVVGALNADGVRSSYSTAGSAIWVSAPGGEFGLNASTFGATDPGGIPYPAYVFEPAMVTTDQTGCAVGYSVTGTPYSAFDGGASPNGQCSYTNTFNGTSSAAPALSGAIALLLDARPSLTWREVKHVLASTARRVDPAVPALVDETLAGGPYVVEPAWTVNAAGYAFHDWYGFGAVDVDHAVAMAQSLVPGTLGTYANSGWLPSATLNLPIPDASALGAAGTLVVPGTPRNLVIESVQIEVTAQHPSPSDLGIELVSPQGTRSVLLTIKNGFAAGSGVFQMVLASNAFYGESAAGTWTMKVVDGVPAGTGTLVEWKIRVYGH
jgi:subtilisin family serine protease/subtilisin-like proprotein convertase family protein